MATLSGSKLSRRLPARQLNPAVKSSILKHYCRINTAASTLPLQRSSRSAELIPLSADQSFSNLAASAEPRQQPSINNQ